MEHIKNLDPKYYGELLRGDKVRHDGRRMNDSRELLITTDRIGTNDGSATVKMGNSMVVCGVNVAPLPKNPNETFPTALAVITRIAPYSASKFNIGSTFRARQTLADLGALISQHIEKIFFNAQILPPLTLFDGHLTWKLSVNIHCLDYGGNLLDLALIAALTALKSTTLPRINFDPDTKEWSIDEEAEKTPLVLNGDAVCCTYAKLEPLIFPDPSREEEEIADAIIHVAHNPSTDSIVYIHKSNGLDFSEKDLSSVIDRTRSRSKEVVMLINEATKKKS